MPPLLNSGGRLTTTHPTHVSPSSHQGKKGNVERLDAKLRCKDACESAGKRCVR